ncbi:MAG: hypothetical protein ACRCUY_10400 [Thermoguttaceae bacterium]
MMFIYMYDAENGCFKKMYQFTGVFVSLFADPSISCIKLHSGAWIGKMDYSLHFAPFVV